MLATLLAYAPLRHAGFLWDDDVMLTANPVVQSPGGLRAIWFSTALPDYFPLTSSLLWLEWKAWGPNPLGYHAVNLLLHLGAVLMLWRVLVRLAVPGALLAAAVFALHPVNVESVAWITEHKNTFAMLWYTIALWAYVRAEEAPPGTRHAAWFALALAAFVLALLAKTAVAPLPCVLLWFAWWRRGRISWRDVGRTVPFFAAAVVLGLVTLWFQSERAIGTGVVRTDGMLSRLASAGDALWFYLGKALAPVSLSFVYPRPILPRQGWLAFVPLATFVAVGVMAYRFRPSLSRGVAFGIGYFALMLLPILGFANVGFMRFSLVADRWQYFALIGPVVLVAAAWTKARARWPILQGPAGVMLAAAVLAALGIGTWRRTHSFLDVGALWRGALQANPAAVVAHTELGVWQFEHGNADAAVSHYRTALEIDPAYESAHYNLGFALLQRGNIAAAKEHLARAIALQRDFMPAHLHLGRALFTEGDIEGAAANFRTTVQLDPNFAEGHYQLGNVALRQDRLDEAIACFDRALALNPRDANALNDRAVVHVRRGEWRAARADWERALALRPELDEARTNLAALAEMEKGQQR